jgi:hypothetical protein
MTYPGAACPGGDQSWNNDVTHNELALITRKHEYRPMIKRILPPYTTCKYVCGTSTSDVDNGGRIEYDGFIII